MSLPIVESARSWIGTPYVHQASCKGAGTDCLGLVRGIWRELFGTEPAMLPHYTADWGELGGDELLLNAARTFLWSSPVEAAGDVLVFRMKVGCVAKHMGIVAAAGPEPSFVHAYERHGVVESPLSGPWRARIAGRFRFPPLN
ncbi:peptidase [Paracoccus sp. MBLB3053]|uniref:Peptidase n=1 Tax=Paracoccus aurantius TaxID=3073814 RepID=A0ABU2HLV1_9RHOB|nr:NlpC/P60 family protein [Paracoccus sp. MBLB3053]MDS9466012.1 peptidase [Paracoccus sp. MBLB3053]